MQLSRRALLAAAAAAPITARAQPSEFKTVKPGALTVAINGELPMTTARDGKLGGTDGEMIGIIAKRLGLEVQPLLMEWSATIESIRSGRADVMLGNMGWTAARAQVLLLTDPVYFPSKFALMKQDKAFANGITVADMKGFSLGTVTGFTMVPELKKVPGTTEVKLYDTSDACVRDVVAGRLDFAFLDAPVVAYLIQQNASWGLKQVPIGYDPAWPVLTTKSQTVFGMSGANPELFDAVNAGIGWLWASKNNAATLAKYGITSATYFEKPEKNLRLGVDRSPEGAIIGPFGHTVKDYSKTFA